MYQPNLRASLQRGSAIQAEAYARALRELSQARREISRVFTSIDALILPTMADPPFKVEEGLARNVSARNTSIFDALVSR